MRNRAFRVAALIVGILGVPSLIWQVSRAWPLDRFELKYFGGQAVILFIFLSFGSGLGPMAPGRDFNKPKTPEGGDSHDA
jgi:hypothetical protein